MKTLNAFMLRGLQLVTIVIAVSVAPLLAYSSQAATIISSKIDGKDNLTAQVTNVGLQFIDAPPQKIIIQALEGGKKILPNPDKNRDIRVIRERQSVSLSEDLAVWNGFKKNNDPYKDKSTIGKNSLVSSYLFYLNPPGGVPDYPRFYAQYYTWSGQIVFDVPILGIIFGKWTKSNLAVGLPSTEYTISTFLDKGNDFVSFNDKTLLFNISAQTGKETWRVILDGNAPLIPSASAPTPVPEPLTILGSATAIGFGTLFRKIKKSQRSFKIKNKAPSFWDGALK